MVWLLPVMIIGGLFFPLLGYLVSASMGALLTLSFFKGRFWCAFLCPRGSFLDIVLSKFSLKRKIPRIFSNNIFRWFVFVIFMGFFVFRILTAEKTLYAIGFVFVQMCLLTTIIASIAGIFTSERCWCVFCPMGTLQSVIAARMKKNKKIK